MRVGDFELGNLFAGEIGRESALPELVLAFDFAFGVGRELHPMQNKQKSISPSRIRFIRGVADGLS